MTSEITVASDGVVQQCTRCLLDCRTRHHIIPDCIPVDSFGVLANADAITLSINPSAGEFFSRDMLKAMRQRFPMDPDEWKSIDWPAKPPTVRLRMLRDFGVNCRESVTDDALRQTVAAKDAYFATDGRRRHPFFTKLQSLLSEVDPTWSYENGSAAHFDIVACTTAKDWHDVPNAAREALISNCLPYLSRTLTAIKSSAWLLLNGSTAWDTLAQVCTLSERAAGSVDSRVSAQTLRWSVGRLNLRDEPGSLALNYIGWNIPWKQHMVFDLEGYLAELLKCIVRFDGDDSALRLETAKVRSPNWQS